MSKNDEEREMDIAQAMPSTSELPGPDAGALSRLSDVAPMGDAHLAQLFERLRAEPGELLVCANAYTVCVHHRPHDQAPWQLVGRGELGVQALQASKLWARARRLWWGSAAGEPWAVDSQAVPKVRATATQLTQWNRTSDKESGREGDVTAAIKDELTYLAGWRCQFDGCGRDLRRHGATARRGRFSYFAHIVAASPSGPRGDPQLSKLLASDPTNFMLLCDECHRLIDKIDPAKYPVPVLRKMREDNIAQVRRLLDSLQYQQAEVIAILGNIAGQPAQFSMDDAEEALRGLRMRSGEAKPSRYFNPGGQMHDVHAEVYWGALFQQLKLDLVALQTLLNGTRSGVARPQLAIFPLHGTSVLLLAGRVLGDMAGTHVFQPHRNKVGTGTRWGWPAPGTLPTPPAAKFQLETLQEHQAGQQEATLLVTLTSDIDPHRLPNGCATDGQLTLPTLRVAGSSFDKDCIGQPEDLQLLARAVDAAIQQLQDRWSVRKVHLFVSAPAAAVVAIGQKMQARHHATFICHEAGAGAGAPYKPTIEISSTTVRELVSSRAQTLSLQP